MSNTTPKGLGPKHNEYTVYATYSDNLQPYAAMVLCATPEEAICLAQLQALEDNGVDPADYPAPVDHGTTDALGDFGTYTLTAFQVVPGNHPVVL